MSTFCIGDIHGRYELFEKLLKKIDFDPNNDHLYFLGDVIDHHYGGIKVLKFIIDNQNACTLIRGNHEENFICCKDAYDLIMLDSKVKEVFKSVLANYSKKFEDISSTFIRKLNKKDINAIYQSQIIRKWINSGQKSVRKRALDNMFILAEALNFDKHKFEEIMYVLSDFNSSYKNKAFVQELLEQDTLVYQQILKLCEEASNKIRLNVNGKSFVLAHSSQECCVKDPRLFFPHANANNTFFIFGHLPVPILHQKLNKYVYYVLHRTYDFNYKAVFSITDKNDNFYYNLDLGSSSTNPQVLLRLDDLCEVYVSANDDESGKDIIECNLTRNFTFNNEIIDGASRISIETFIGNSREFLIEAHSNMQTVSYNRVDLLDLCVSPWRQKSFIIDSWYKEQSPEQIIEKVVKDYEVQKEQPENIKSYNFLCGKKEEN